MSSSTRMHHFECFGSRTKYTTEGSRWSFQTMWEACGLTPWRCQMSAGASCRHAICAPSAGALVPGAACVNAMSSTAAGRMPCGLHIAQAVLQHRNPPSAVASLGQELEQQPSTHQQRVTRDPRSRSTPCAMLSMPSRHAICVILAGVLAPGAVCVNAMTSAAACRKTCGIHIAWRCVATSQSSFIGGFARVPA